MELFAQISQKYNLKLLRAPIRLSGGLMHKMYLLDTEQGRYALKLLNPSIMQRHNALENFSRAEQLEHLLEQQSIPLLPALIFGGKKMQKIGENYFYLFDYFNGKPLKIGEIQEIHCQKMGAALAMIHSTDQKNIRREWSETKIDWAPYLAKLKDAEPLLYEQLNCALPLLEQSLESGNRARANLAPILSVCHNDMDCKNVLWSGEEYRIIDLECLSYNHPFLELFETALCWAGYDQCSIDFDLFQAFLQGYKNAGGAMPTDWETLYSCNNGSLRWLEYNLRRALGIDCAADEKELGRKQAEETLSKITYYFKMKSTILAHCDSIGQK